MLLIKIKHNYVCVNYLPVLLAGLIIATDLLVCYIGEGEMKCIVY